MLDNLAAALTQDLNSYHKLKVLLPGVYGGWDPAEVNDGSAFVVLGKDVPTYDLPNPKLRSRLLRDLSLDDHGIKNMGYLPQANKILQLDAKLHFTRLTVDITNQSTVYEFLREKMGPRVVGVKFSKPLKADMINATKIVFQENLIEFDSTHLYFNLLRKELYELDPIKLKHPDSGTDDFAWALALAIRSTDVVSYRSGIDSGESSEELIF